MDNSHSNLYESDAQHIPQRTQLRREHLLKHIELSSKGLEIGPYDYPTVFKSEGNISYLDFKSRDQLVAECSSKDEIDSIPETDYIVASNNYREYISETFDYIIANHVLEHVPDCISWLINISSMLNPEGILFLALPDKKFTFDKFRQNTRLSHILNDFYGHSQTISQEHLLEQVIYYDRSYLGEPTVASVRLSRSRIEKILSEGIQPRMIGYHCHVFQSETVLDTVFKPLIMMGYVDLDIVDFVPASGINYGEMMIIFKKTRSELLDRPNDLPSFFERDFQTDMNQEKSSQMDKFDKNLTTRGKFKLIPPFIKDSKISQKYLKPLYKKIFR